MAAIKPLSKCSTKWKTVASVSQDAYKDGVSNPRKDWATETASAEPRYKTGVTQAIAQGRFGKGVAAAGTAKWKENAVSKGPDRWANGIALSTDNYERGFRPFHDTISSLTLPEKGPTNDPKNYSRVSAVGNALHQKKLQLKGGA